MVLSASNKVDVMGRSVGRTTITGHRDIQSPIGATGSSSTSLKSASGSMLSETSEKVSNQIQINDDLLKMIITNNINRNKLNKHDQYGQNDHVKSIMNVGNMTGFEMKAAGGVGSKTILSKQQVQSDSQTDSNNKSMPSNCNQHKEMSTMLDSNRVRTISTYFNYSSIVSHAIKDYFEGNIRGKLGSQQIVYDNVLLYMAYLFCARNILLAFIEDVELRAWLGEVERVRPYRQLVMVITIWSVYIVAILRNFRPDPVGKQHQLSWLEPFRVLRGECTPKSFGLSEQMLHGWFDYSMSMWRFYFGFVGVIFVCISLQTLGLLRHRWNTYGQAEMNNWYNMCLLFWSIYQIIWAFITATHTYICIVYFNSLCYYFRIRYEKVNEDIEVIINKRLKANERVALLHHILLEHNSLCLKVSEYNKFWASHLMSTYFFLVAVVCFSSFQAFFTANLVIIRLYMFLVALLAGFIITRISVSAAIMSNRAHEPYGRLIRVTFEKYPVELQIQLRMFIQRTSGPTIGFYCLDVFEITYTTYASILAALGQNFLLIVDFVRSYAEVGKEYEEISFSDLNLLTGSVLNSTLDVLDEMTGTHLSSTLHSNNSFISF